MTRLVPVPDLDQPVALTLQQMAHEITTAGATSDRQWRMPALLAEPRPAARAAGSPTAPTRTAAALSAIIDRALPAKEI